MSHLRRLDGYGELQPFVDASDEEALVRLGITTLVRIPGTTPGAPARLVACLLHGNEDSGYRAVLALLRSRPSFPFDLWVLIGNVEAASQAGWFAHRYLEGQEDFNRIWGRRPHDSVQRRCAAQVLDIVRSQPLEAVIDLHNTTGHNPPHAIVPEGRPGSDKLGAACCDVVLRWGLGAHTLMEELSADCPAVGVECGIAGAPASTRTATEVLRRFLGHESLNGAGKPRLVLQIQDRVTVRPGVSFGFGALSDGWDLALAPGLDEHNFRTMPAGSAVGMVRDRQRLPLQAVSTDGHDVTEHTFVIDGDGRLCLKRAVTPVLMARAVTQTRQDCYFYTARRL